MKKIIYILFFSLSASCQVPDTDTFSLLDVKNEIGTNVNNLSDVFANANDSGFDPAYSGNKKSLLNFRNYSHTTNRTETFTFTSTKNESFIIEAWYHDTSTNNYYSFDTSWVSTGDLVSSGNSQNIDLTGNTGSATVVVTLTIPSHQKFNRLRCNSDSITDIDISTNLDLIELQLHWNDLISLDISNNTKLTNLYLFKNNLTTTVIDKIYTDLDASNQINGSLRIDTGRTSASATAYASLITKNWSITEH